MLCGVVLVFGGAFFCAVVEGTAIRVLPMVDVTVHQAARVPTERIR